jgi:hypothetical protein
MADRQLTKPHTGLHRTLVKVRKPDGEETIAGMRGNGRDAPIPAVRRTAVEPPQSSGANLTFGARAGKGR